MMLRVSLFAWALLAGVSTATIAPSRANPADGFQLRFAPLADVVGMPPATNSDGWRRDLAVVRWQQFARDSELVGHAWSYLDRDIGRFQGAIGSDFVKTAPRIRAGVPQFVRLVDEVKNQLKYAMGRSRPFVTHQDLKPCLPREDSASYPSGHATWYVTTSLLLADLLPERRERLLAVGHQGMAARVTCGMHYPSDVEAGQRLGEAAVKQILRSPQWKRFKLSVQPEVKALISPPAAGMPVVYD
ncbi:phosphatase PAP2 family protein [Prochlorococcus marinus]|uniref:phosphatase PAP2 family protein n=1 Tax=Prochlorococcus TaxID=1218 RepID=UPI001F44AE33|nr:phosphatase PAP2 family protein [Prochlorococcus marinus]